MLYDIVAGPLTWLAFTVFFVGLAVKAARLHVAARKADRAFYDHFDAKAAATSVVRWLTPMGTHGWRLDPLLCILSFIFHATLIIIPLSALGHAVFLDMAFGVLPPALPESGIDILTLAFLASALGLLVRRMVIPRVRAVTTPVDYILWAVVVAPFVTGYLASEGVLAGDVGLALHIFAGCVFLVAVPLTKLSHALTFFAARAMTGVDFARRQSASW